LSSYWRGSISISANQHFSLRKPWLTSHPQAAC
jgi:hypothetical protein